MSDLVERLRLGGPNALEVADEAADEIGRLEAEVSRLTGRPSPLCASARPEPVKSSMSSITLMWRADKGRERMMEKPLHPLLKVGEGITEALERQAAEVERLTNRLARHTDKEELIQDMRAEVSRLTTSQIRHEQEIGRLRRENRDLADFIRGVARQLLERARAGG